MTRKIPMLDLKSQYAFIEKEVLDAIQAVIKSSAFIQGKEVGCFEMELASKLEVAHCISCGNGTDALQLSLMALELQAGDEIIVPAFTYIAPVEAVALLNLKPVLIDVDACTFNISPDQIERSISPKTKAIIVVHLYGQCAAMEKILALAKKYKLYVIEDNAQSILSEYIYSNGISVKAGCIGDIGTTSFFPSKNLGTYGDGGALMTNNANLAKTIKTLANHGQEEKYIHSKIGINSRLDTLQAAILNIKLKYLNDYTQRRQEAAAIYDRELSRLTNLLLPFRTTYSTHVFHQYTIRVKDRDKLKAFLSNKGIDSMIYYPIPVHLQPAYSYLGYVRGDFPIAELLSEEVLSLPMHSELKEDDVMYICESIKEFYNYG